MNQMKKCICTLLMLLVLSLGSTAVLSCMIMPVAAEAAEVKKGKATADSSVIVEKYEELIRSKFKNVLYYGCYDFDKDGIKEILIVDSGYTKFEVLDYSNGKLTSMGKGKFCNGFSISSDGKYLFSSNADLIFIYDITGKKMKLHHKYIYPATSNENSKKYKKWISGIELLNKTKGLPIKNYRSLNKAVKALYKAFNK